MAAERSFTGLVKSAVVQGSVPLANISPQSESARVGSRLVILNRVFPVGTACRVLTALSKAEH